MISDWKSLPRDRVPLSYMEVSEVDRRLLSQVELAGQRLLNVGCGVYDTSDGFFFARGASVTSLDIGLSLLKSLKTNKNLPRVVGARSWDVVLADGRRLPFDDASLDIVTSFSAIEHIPAAAGRIMVFEEIFRVLKPGGYAALTFPNFWFLPATLMAPIWRSRTGEFEYRYSPRQLRRILLGIGYEEILFDGCNPETFDENALQTFLPRFAERLPSFVFGIPSWFFRVSNRIAALRPFRMRMGFLVRKP